MTLAQPNAPPSAPNPTALTVRRTADPRRRQQLYALVLRLCEGHTDVADDRQDAKFPPSTFPSEQASE